MSPELNGILVVDKPAGMSSAAVVARVKAIVGAKKVGHTGTLDPFATGVLICCLNQATRLARFFLEGDKTYEAELILGTTTDTQDLTGRVIGQHPVAPFTARQIRETAARFVGRIAQVPPAFSALKHRGTPLYKLARKGQMVAKPPRPVEIHRLDILELDLPTVRFSVTCSAGTYIRTLCADMGQALGCGGHLGGLRRTVSCGYAVDQAVHLDRLAECAKRGDLGEIVIPMDAVLPTIPATTADQNLAAQIQNGVKLSAAALAMPCEAGAQGVFRVLDPKGHLIAILSPSPTMDGYDYCCVFSAQR